MTRIRLYIKFHIQDISNCIHTTQTSTSGSEIQEGHAFLSLCVKAVVGGKSSFRFEKETGMWKPRLFPIIDLTILAITLVLGEWIPRDRDGGEGLVVRSVPTL